MGAFAWNADQPDAVFVPNGGVDALGSGACHRGDVGRILGFSAIQLSRLRIPAFVGPSRHTVHFATEFTDCESLSKRRAGPFRLAVRRGKPCDNS
jgi:hypothetical protein